MSAAPQTNAAATTVEKYGRRFWAVRNSDGELIAVTVYRRGALRVAEIIETLSLHITPDAPPNPRGPNLG